MRSPGAGRMQEMPKEVLVMAANPQTLKQYLHALADELPDTATTDEALYHLELRRDIEAGLADCEAGRTVPHEVVLRRYGLSE